MNRADFMAEANPYEDVEQRAVIVDCRDNDIPVFHVPNSTFTKSPKIKADNKALGVTAGIPDLWVVTRSGLIIIELKRRKGGVLSAAQKYWLKILQACRGIEARRCNGSDEAIDFIEEYHGKGRRSGSGFGGGSMF